MPIAELVGFREAQRLIRMRLLPLLFLLIGAGVTINTLSVFKLAPEIKEKIGSIASPSSSSRSLLVERIHESKSLGASSFLVHEHDYIYEKNGIWDAAPIVIQSKKLIFFTTPKVGCTTFKQLFRRMMGISDWRSQRTPLPHNPKKNGLKYLSEFSIEEANEMLTSPLYTRAIFVRDPKLRFLSAFLDKALSNDGVYLKAKCGIDNDGVKQAQTIEGFLQLVGKCDDTHWRPQSDRMETKYWKSVNFIGHLEEAANDTKRLLQSIGAWDEFGLNGWGKDGNCSIFQNPDDAGSHATWSQWAVWKWFTQALEREVEAFYAEDYANPLLNFSRGNLVDY